MIHIPQISKLDLSGGSFAEGWRGATAHIGPVGAVTPLVDMLSGKTNCGTLSMMAGVSLWGSARLKHFIDVDFTHELVDAVFAWQHDWRYVDVSADPYFSPPDMPPTESALFTLDEFIRDSIDDKKKWISFYAPIIPLFHMCNVVNFILLKDQRKLFETWLSDVNTRMNEIATAPKFEAKKYFEFDDQEAFAAYNAPRRGTPLPPVVLDLEANLAGMNLQSEAEKFLQSLDHTKNRFLRSPAQLVDMGFEGLPYGRPA
jgi:hypothetical protein